MITNQLPKFFIALIILIAIPDSHAESAINDCKGYAKYGLPGQSGTLLCRKGYLLAHDPVRKTPIWVAEHLTSDKARGSNERANNFQPDPDLIKGERAELLDYKGSG